jgi:hypothetical protein
VRSSPFATSRERGDLLSGHSLGLWRGRILHVEPGGGSPSGPIVGLAADAVLSSVGDHPRAEHAAPPKSSGGIGLFDAPRDILRRPPGHYGEPAGASVSAQGCRMHDRGTMCFARTPCCTSVAWTLLIPGIPPEEAFAGTGTFMRRLRGHYGETLWWDAPRPRERRWLLVHAQRITARSSYIVAPCNGGTMGIPIVEHCGSP